MPGGGIAASLIRNPSETDPQMARGQRVDFPPALEREVVEGGSRANGRDAGNRDAIIWIFVILVVILVAVGILVNWSRLFP